MADIQAFRAYRYDLARVGALSDVVAPPYDVIDAGLQEGLYARSPYNVIRLILNKEEPADDEKANRYTRAARHLREWQQSGVLKQDSARALYVYHQEFETEGGHYTRRGFLARVRLERFGEGKVFPHEQTMPGPRADRLQLFRATAMNLSPIFGLYPDDESAVQSQLDESIGRDPPLEARDHLGVVSRLWPVTDQHVVSAVTGLMGPKPVYLADGHHRYETALAYLEERRAAEGIRDSEAAPNFVLMMLVGMSDPGLVILPTHRLVSEIPALDADQLKRVLGNHFDMELIGKGNQAASDTWEIMQVDGGQDVLGFGTGKDGAWQTARFKSPQLIAEVAPQQSAAWRALAVSILHKVVLERLVHEAFGSQPVCGYVHQLSEVSQAVAGAKCSLGVLVPPADMGHVQQIAGNSEKMPAKSTYFYPKLLSGLVFNSLKTH
jgi:uncharacterized protein (DUF1015 family)